MDDLLYVERLDGTSVAKQFIWVGRDIDEAETHPPLAVDERVMKSRMVGSVQMSVKVFPLR